MAFGYYRAQVIIPADTGLPEDACVNVWSFKSGSDPTDEADDAVEILNTLDAFYTPVAGILSSRVNPAAMNCKVFDLKDPTPRVPILEAPIDAGGSTTSNMDFPPEVAMCLSFKGAAASGANARRRRGRIYIGPIQSSTTTDYHEILASHISTVMGAVGTALTPPSGGLVWCVYSPYTHHGVPVGANINDKVPGTDDPLYPEVPTNLDDSFVPITTYWMDNAWDTQRRRGTKATSRSTASV